jgi:ABC-type dipeptide/oligopeptide/nickel transport system permease component
VIIGTTLLYAAVVLVVNILVDVSYAALDPRIQYDA